MKKPYEIAENIIKHKNNGNPIVLFGAGKIGLEALSFLRTNIVPITCFCDNNKFGQNIDGIEIISAKKLNEAADNGVVIISSMFYDDIFKQLTELGGSYDLIRYSTLKAIKDNLGKYENFEADTTDIQKTLGWLSANKVSSGGIVQHSGTSEAYPEVTGYIIPTLLDYGMRNFALELGHWLLSVQKRDGGVV